VLQLGVFRGSHELDGRGLAAGDSNTIEGGVVEGLSVEATTGDKQVLFTVGEVVSIVGESCIL